MRAINASAFISHMLQGTLVYEWADTRLVNDDPAKGMGKAASAAMLTYQLTEPLGRPTRNVDLISPYFVPTVAGVEVFTTMVKGGIKRRVLTNSLDARDVAVVHAGYAKRRKDLLEAGVTLYEMCSRLPETDRKDRDKEKAGLFGSSGSSLSESGKIVWVETVGGPTGSSRHGT